MNCTLVDGMHAVEITDVSCGDLSVITSAYEVSLSVLRDAF